MKKPLNNKELVERNKILTRKLKDSIKYYSERIKNLERKCDFYEKKIKNLEEIIKTLTGDSF